MVTPDKPEILCSNDPLLGGDPRLHNLEHMLLSALSACHMLWYLHLASEAGVVVHDYDDQPVATGENHPNGAGRFVGATLRPTIAVGSQCDLALADSIHERIHAVCFIAQPVNFPVTYAPTYQWLEAGSASQAHRISQCGYINTRQYVWHSVE